MIIIKMKPLLLTIALLFSTPAWAVTPGCEFDRGKWTSNEIKDSIELNDCEHVIFKSSGVTPRIAKICRFDREIVLEPPKDAFSVGYVLCVPKKNTPQPQLTGGVFCTFATVH